jgi:hypothetical protein
MARPILREAPARGKPRPARLPRQQLSDPGGRIPALRRAARFGALAPTAIAAGQPSGVPRHFGFLQDSHARAADTVGRGGASRRPGRVSPLPRGAGDEAHFRLRGPRSLVYTCVRAVAPARP